MISLRSFSSNFIDVMVKGSGQKANWDFTGFYGSLVANSKKDSWNELRTLAMNNDSLWLVCGDFNKILYAFEKKEPTKG